MLGEMIGEDKGKVVVQRVLPSDGPPSVEVSFEATGRIVGVEVTEMGTYTSTVRADGTMFGEGQGILMGKGGETITWRGQGIGRFRKDGGTSYRGAVYYQTTAKNLLHLNNIAAVFEHEAEPDGTTRSKIWEWK